MRDAFARCDFSASLRDSVGFCFFVDLVKKWRCFSHLSL
jgi:hypothetical protein